MTMAARLTALLMLLSLAEMAHGEQGRVLWATAPPAVSGLPTVTYAPSAQGTLVLPPPPPQTVMSVPVQVGPVVTYRPLVPVVPVPAQYYLGRGLLGQPKLYVPNQPVRNFFRYLGP